MHVACQRCQRPIFLTAPGGCTCAAPAPVLATRTDRSLRDLLAYCQLVIAEHHAAGVISGGLAALAPGHAGVLVSMTRPAPGAVGAVKPRRVRIPIAQDATDAQVREAIAAGVTLLARGPA